MSRKTITDVAAAAGVAIKTVSRVLNNEPKVREATRERVHGRGQGAELSPQHLGAGACRRGARSCIGPRVREPERELCDGRAERHDGALPRRALPAHHASLQRAGRRTSPADIASLVDQTHVDGLVLTPPLSSSKELIDDAG